MLRQAEQDVAAVARPPDTLHPWDAPGRIIIMRTTLPLLTFFLVAARARAFVGDPRQSERARRQTLCSGGHAG
jgi:hypothetical protein